MSTPQSKRVSLAEIKRCAAEHMGIGRLPPRCANEAKYLAPDGKPVCGRHRARYHATKHIDFSWLVRIPGATYSFFYDHLSRSLPTPKVHRATSGHVWIGLDDPALPELLDDAKYYAGWRVGGERGIDPQYSGLVASARATVHAIETAQTHRSTPRS